MIVSKDTETTERKQCFMQQEIDETEKMCGVPTAIAVMGGKWKPMILYCLLIYGPQRFGELNRLIPDVTQRMLTLQLRELEVNRIIHREIYKQVPPKVEYSLTPFGRTLEPILRLMKEWGECYADEVSRTPTPSHCDK
jgi:DNA-binding HxlR family transcriptional regulator